MKIMAFVGSPRKGSNVDILVDKVIEGAQSKTAVEIEKIYLYIFRLTEPWIMIFGLKVKIY